MPELNRSFDNGLVREAVQSWRLDTNEVTGDNRVRIGCFPMHRDSVRMSKKGKAFTFKRRCNVTSRSVDCKNGLGVPYNPKIILYTGFSRDALDGLYQLAANRRAMILLPVLCSRRHDNRANTRLGQPIDRYRPFFRSPILASPTRRGINVEVIGR